MLSCWSRFLAVALVALAAPACFAGYDSRWGQSKQVQRQMAQAEAPTLRADPSSEDRPASTKTYRVRAYVTRPYTAQVADVPKSLRDLFDDANDVMEPLAGVHLELDGIRTWELAADDDLTKVLAELRTMSSGEDAPWIVGFVSALPRATASFHDAGVGDTPGKHIVLRAPSSAMRHDAIERVYGDLPEAERQAVHQRDRRHRAAAVFLHELGHTLGALHERADTNLMFPEYRTKMKSFSPTATATMRLFVERREPKTLEDQAALYRDLAAQIRKSPDGIYFDEERTKNLASFDAFVDRAEKASAQHAPPAQPAPAQAKSSGAPALPDDLEKIPVADRTRFTDARAKMREGDWVGAWETAKPLFAAHPDVMSIQDLRCQIASQVFQFAVTRRECEPLMELAKRPR
jgi:hypothetical protein